MSLRGATDPNTAAMGQSLNADPQSAQAMLTSMIHNGPAAGPAGTNQVEQKPGGEMGGANTPSTNPIGMYSGIGMDPGGTSPMGNAAFGTQNNVLLKSSQLGKWFQKRAVGTSAVPKRFPREFGPRIGGLPPKPGQVPQSQAPKPQPPSQTMRGPSTAPKMTMYKKPDGSWGRRAVGAAQYRQAVQNQPTRTRGQMAQRPMMAGQGAQQYDPVAALSGAPAAPSGLTMTPEQQAVWAQRGGDPAWRERAIAWLQRGQQQPRQQLAQAPQRTTAKIPGAEWAKQREAYLRQKGASDLGKWIVKRASSMPGTPAQQPPPQPAQQPQQQPPKKTQAQINRELVQQPKQKPNLPPIVNGPAGPVKQAEQLMAFLRSRKGR